jgi:hypothetical protein
MDTWRGHFPITHFVLRALHNKRTSANAADYSRAEEVLLAACEFWAAAASRQLALYLDPDPVAKILVAFEAFSEIGAVRVASALRVAAGDCSDVPSSILLRQNAFDLEAQLLDTEDAVDRLIAEFASEHLADDSIGTQPENASPLIGTAR